MRTFVILVIAVIADITTAYAYPEFQLSRDQTCANCHLSPAGGELLSENGLIGAEQMSQWGGAPEAFNGKIPIPSWLVVGGDFRGAAGLDNDGLKNELVIFPMQAEAYAEAALGSHFSLHVTAGVRPPQDGDTAATLFSSREHWLSWRPHPGERDGWFVRAGRFMPVYGLRFAEHPDYDRRFGGTPLYGEAYGISAEYVQPGWELHVTGFTRDPLLPDSVEQGNGAALYTEKRVTSATSIGLEGMFVKDPDDERFFGGVTAKHYLSSLDILLEMECEGVHQKVLAGGTENQIVGYESASYFYKTAFMVDLGFGYFNENVLVKGLDREAFDLNIHWFTTSHLELILTNRIQFIELGQGGTSSGYSLLQFHYRL
jgi:hypothetical protein